MPIINEEVFLSPISSITLEDVSFSAITYGTVLYACSTIAMASDNAVATAPFDSTTKNGIIISTIYSTIVTATVAQAVYSAKLDKLSCFQPPSAKLTSDPLVPSPVDASRGVLLSQNMSRDKNIATGITSPTTSTRFQLLGTYMRTILTNLHTFSNRTLLESRHSKHLTGRILRLNYLL